MCDSWKKYIYIFLPAAAFATNEMESDMDKDRGGRFLKNCFLDYISKKQKPVFFLAHDFDCLLVVQPSEVLAIWRILLPAGRVRRKG